MDVFINDVAAFLPNAPVDNDKIEEVLGRVGGASSKARRIVLKSNQIRKRYYALDPATGRLTHTNAQLTAGAVRGLDGGDFSPDRLDCLCCGTSTPDVLIPGHGLMVLGELGGPECETMSASGICISGMTALKYAWMNVAAGMADTAVATGSELASSFTRAAFFLPLLPDDAGLEKRPIRAFDADFLRWMLSDGAGAALLSPRPNPDGARPSLKIEWIDQVAFSGELETCMYAGGVKNGNGAVAGWREVEAIADADAPYRFSIRQDIRLLDKHIVSTMGAALSRIARKRDLTPDAIDWFLPHYSSAYFRPKFQEEMRRVGFGIPEEKWFTNLPDKGNTGSAAIYIILEELFHSGRLRSGEKLLCFIPESGRFSHCFMLLTVV
jgi:3-oxoacyl-[acyl-carrier-protein] synthase III